MFQKRHVMNHFSLFNYKEIDFKMIFWTSFWITPRLAFETAHVNLEYIALSSNEG